MKTKIILISIVVALFFFGCNKDDKDDNNDNSNNTNNNIGFDKNFGNFVNRDFIGQVVDNNDQPLQNATIEIDTKTVQTDKYGVFIIDDARVYERFAFIKAKKPGFIDGSRSLVPTEGKNNIRIMLLPATPTQTIQSGTTTEVALPSGTKVVFDGSFSDESGTNYSGAVTVSEYHLTPSNPNISSIMPGMLYGAAQNQTPSVLVTFGMMNVELRGSGGQKLQIAKGHNAELTMKIDNSQLAKAPATIPLWYFDEKNGYWIQEGTATKNGDKYIGTVSHFSWWNCDTFASTVNLTVKIVDSKGNPLSNIGVGLVAKNNFTSYTQTTDNNGQVSGLVPGNETITLSVYDFCGSLAYTTSIGSISGNTVLPNIIISNNIQSSTIQGTLVDCDYLNVNTGYVFFVSGNKSSVYQVNSGGFNFETLICGNNTTFTLEGLYYNFDNPRTTGIISYNFNSPVTNIGHLITSCTAVATVNEFISYKIGNEPTNYIIGLIDTKYTRWDIDYSTFKIYAGQTFPNTKYGREFYLFSEPVLTTSSSRGFVDIHIFANSKNYKISSFTFNENGTVAIPNLNTIYSLSKFGKVGDYIDASFEGVTENEDGTKSSISGVIHVKRDK